MIQGTSTKEILFTKRVSEVELHPFSKGDLVRWIKCLNCSSPVATKQLFSHPCIICGYRNMQYGVWVMSSPDNHKTLKRKADEYFEKRFIENEKSRKVGSDK